MTPWAAKRDRLLTAAALAVDRGAGDRLRETGAQQGVPGDVDRLIAHLRHGAGNHVVDVCGIHAGTGDQLGQAVCEQVGRQDVVQRAAGLALADRGADRPHDHGVPI